MAEIVIMPKLGFDMAEGTLVRWVVSEGQEVTKGSVLVEVETDKATVEVESAHSGTVLAHLVPEGEVVPVNTPIAVIGTAGEVVDFAAMGLAQNKPGAPKTTATKVQSLPAVVQQVEPQAVPTVSEPGLPDGVKASPLARRMAADLGIDLRTLRGSGPGGRIVRSDVEAAHAMPVAEQIPAKAISPVSAEPVGVPTIQIAPRTATRVPLSRLRQAIARRMSESKQQLPHFYVTQEYRMEALLALRKQVNALLPEAEKVSVNDFLIKAAALALQSYPNLNASLDPSRNEIIQHGSVHMGIAVAVEGGLLTVVVRDADLKPLRQIAAEVKTLVARAREGKVRPEDIEGSTFSLSNLGMYDVENFVAIINPPEAAILAIGSAREVPIVENGQIKPGVTMKATISVDHRVSDGAEAARFMQHLRQYLEEPLRLMI
jgi:pyruvate dehydrogenase E2 component (dihydrolipoamide acetyltransferase)